MAADDLIADDPVELGLDPQKVAQLMARAHQEVAQGLLPSAQVAIARHGRIGATATFDRARQDGTEREATGKTRYPIFSCTKAIVSAAAWILIGEGRLDVSRRVVEVVPEFGRNGKESVTVEHLFLHQGGFPSAGFVAEDWENRDRRLRYFADWRLEWQPGSRYEYHPTSAFWVIAEIIERCAGDDWREFVRRRIAEPLGLPALKPGVDSGADRPIADFMFLGEPPGPEELARIGLSDLNRVAVDEESLLALNRPAVRAVGVPGGGGIMTAVDLALFYQALLADLGSAHARVWKAETLREALTVRSGDHVDPMLGYRCNRALGVVIAGDDGLQNFRGFATANSPQAFGHGGAGGQIGWADPATGISFAYITNCYDRNFLRQARRTIELSTLAAQSLA